jgi:hypothetical protein
MPGSPERVAAAYLRGLVCSAEQKVDVDVLRWLLARTKKGKGIVQIPIVERAFALMPGWAIVDSRTFLLLNGMDGTDILKHMLHQWAMKWGLRYIHGHSTTEPMNFRFQAGNDVEEARREFMREVDVVSGKVPSGTAQIGRLYATKPHDVDTIYEARGFMVDRVWLGVPGWVITAPSGQTVTLPSPVSRKGKPDDPGRIEKFARFWTWLYKNGVAESAKQALDQHGAETIDTLTAPAAERKRIEQRRIILPHVEKLLRKIVDAKFQEVWDAWTNYHLGALKHYIESQDAAWEQVKDTPHPEWSSYTYFQKHKRASFYDSFIFDATEQDPNRPRSWKVRRGNYRDIARVFAKRIAEGLREEFVRKNAYKLSMIVRTKGNLKDAKVMRVNAGSDFGGEIAFVFDDGSGFTVRNKTVYKISPLGTPFEQFPTTFHDVVLPDGKAMSTPSEARMIDVFAVS